MNVSASNDPSGNGSRSALPSTMRIRSARPAASTRSRPVGEHLGALVEADHVAAGPAHELDRDRGRAGRHVERRFLGPDLDAGDEEPAPARILPEREQPAPAVVRRAERGEEVARGAVPLGEGGHARLPKS